MSVENKYSISEVTWRGILFLEISGEQFSYVDLFELIGKHGYMTTFSFKENSDAFRQYGESVTGTLLYSKKELGDLERNIPHLNEKVKINPSMHGLNQAKHENLKYGGIKLEDILSINVLPIKKELEIDESGEKEIPDVIQIPFKADPRFDLDIQWQNLFVRKLNAGKKLFDFEKEKLIGITLAINNGAIRPEIVELLGYTREKILTSKNIWHHVYKTKERRKTPISESEERRYSEVEISLYFEKMKKFTEEVVRASFKTTGIPEERALLSEVVASIANFEPSVLLAGGDQIYWDVDSYIHIVLRHVKKFQIGRFKNKTPFPYKFEDLKLLIDKVLGIIDEEIERHFKEKPGQAFKRHGSMSVLFNGDYFRVHIDKDGRLVTIHLV